MLLSCGEAATRVDGSMRRAGWDALYAGSVEQGCVKACRPAAQVQVCVRQLRCAVPCPALQSVTTGKTPLAALGQHLSDPWSNTVFDVEHARLLAQ